MNLVELFDNIVQMQNLNGVPLANGKMYVYALGRTRLMDTWSDVDGESLNSNPIILDAAGQCHCYVTDDFDYTVVVTDAYDNEIFSIDKYLYSKGSHSHADVAVAPSETIAVSSYHVGECTIYVPYLTGQLGKVYEGIDPIVVNNTEDKISANHVPLGVQDPLYFVQDDEEGCIIGFSGETVPEGVMVESALGFENDKITGYNGSAFSAGNEYEEGSYISIDNNVISVTGLSPVPSDTASTGLVAQVSADIVSQIPSTAGLATTAQLDEKLDKADSANFYPMESNPSGYLTGLPSDLATTGWVDSQGYLTAVDIPESANWNSTYNTVSANSAQWAGGTANPQIPVTGINGIKISESGDKVVFEVSADYATQDWVTSQGYLTAETDWSDTITAASANAYNEATAAIPTGLATTGDLQTVSGEITAMIPSTAGLASEDWVTGQGYITTDAITGKQDITGMTAYATVESLTSKQDAGDYLSATDSANFLLTSDSGNFYPSNNPSAFITGVDLTPYQTTAGMTAYLTTGDSAEFMTTAERSDYIPTGVSSEFYTTANTANYISEVPDTYLQNTDLSTEDGKVTAISGIPLSAGGDVPEGVMVESGLEYNAVGEISGYGNSAIAQYGAEKQWLTHDDTIVHVSNSAQYAFGVNLSGISADLARMMGVDETVLWSGAVSGVNVPIVLSESLNNFNKVKFKLSMDNCNNEVVYDDYVDSRTYYGLTLNNMSNSVVYMNWLKLSANDTHDTLIITATKNVEWNGTTTATAPTQSRVNWEWTCRALSHIIGIGRKN